MISDMQESSTQYKRSFLHSCTFGLRKKHKWTLECESATEKHREGRIVVHTGISLERIFVAMCLMLISCMSLMYSVLSFLFGEYPLWEDFASLVFWL